jgi:hypothetical protein
VLISKGILGGGAVVGLCRRRSSFLRCSLAPQ